MSVYVCVCAITCFISFHSVSPYFPSRLFQEKKMENKGLLPAMAAEEYYFF